MTRGRQLERSGRGERSRTLEEVLARKRELADRSAEQRQSLAGSVEGLAPAFAAGDRVLGWGRSLLSRPLLLVGAGALLVALWPRAVFGLATRGFALWSGARAARRLFDPAG